MNCKIREIIENDHLERMEKVERIQDELIGKGYKLIEMDDYMKRLKKENLI